MQSRRLFLASAALAVACATGPSMPLDKIYEFRDYELRPGQRDVLITLFEREFIEPQEALGAHVRATFRDLDDPDRFVWIRSFADPQSRFAALNGFYTGPVWQAHRTAANATMIDSDNVLQLRPIFGGLGDEAPRPIGASATPNTLIIATTYFLSPGGDDDFAALFASEVPMLGAAAPFATFATDHSPNVYPRLPVRESETVFLTLTHATSVHASGESNQAVERLLTGHLVAPTQTRRLQPTARSALR